MATDEFLLSEGRVTVRPPWIWPQAAYVHVPFCAHKCGYCDFASLAGADHLADRYLDALSREISRLGTPQPVRTIFLGGGTPTRLTVDQLRRLLEVIGLWLPLETDGEFTVEANPGTLNAEKVEALIEGGVNRVSMGAQSFSRSILRTLERDHDPEEVARAVELIAPRFERWSLDLIFGVPGSTLEDWNADLDRALAFEPPHLSCYALIFERGTDLWKRYQKDLIHPIDEEIERSMMESTIDRLTVSSRSMYEISNFAKPGQQSVHNHVYWANDAYFGFGLGAARYVDGVRSVNTRDLRGYLNRIESDDDPTGPREQLNPEERARETAILMLRRTKLGLDRLDFLERTGFEIDFLAGSVIQRFSKSGHLEDDGRRIRLSKEGIYVADSILCELV